MGFSVLQLKFNQMGRNLEGRCNVPDPLTDEEDATMELTIRAKGPMNMYIHKMLKC